jgi:hypothetical protein
MMPRDGPALALERGRAFYGVDDDRTRQAAWVADAFNGWLALRRSVPGLAPSADAVAEAVRAA